MVLRMLLKLILMSCIICSAYELCDNDDTLSKIDKIISKVLQCRPFPGIAISVVKDGRILIAKGYGNSDIETQSPVTNKTLFQISSITKAFASTLLLKQIKQKKNKLTEVIGKDFKFSEDMWTQNADLKDLLSMNLAIPNHNGIRLTKSITRKNLPRLIRYLEPMYGFRTTFTYANLNYGIASHISEKLAGEQWENLIQREIFDPLDMSSSTFLTRNNIETLRDLATGYDIGHNGLLAVPKKFISLFSSLCGSNCILSNAIDMSKWMMLQLKKGINEQGKEIFDRDIIEQTQKPWTLIRAPKLSKLFSQPDVPVSSTESSYGLGWKNGHYRGHRTHQHPGSSFGFSAFITLFPDQNIGIFVAMNGRDPNYITRMLIINYLSDLLLGVQPWLNESTICTFPCPFHNDPPEYQTLTVDRCQESTRPLPEYEGVYSHDAYGNISVTYSVTSRRLNLEFGIGKWTLFPSSITNNFKGLAEGILKEIWDLDSIQFDSRCHKCLIYNVSIDGFSKMSPPTFKRVLMNGFPACPDYKK